MKRLALVSLLFLLAFSPASDATIGRISKKTPQRTVYTVQPYSSNPDYFESYTWFGYVKLPGPKGVVRVNDTRYFIYIYPQAGKVDYVDGTRGIMTRTCVAVFRRNENEAYFMIETRLDQWEHEALGWPRRAALLTIFCYDGNAAWVNQAHEAEALRFLEWYFHIVPPRLEPIKSDP